MNTQSANLRLVHICLFAALMAALGLIPRIDLPIAAGVPITAQTLGVMLAGLVLGPRAGALAVLLFLFVVALGMPFLAGGRGGLGVFFGPTAGFLFGWIAGALMTGLIGNGLRGARQTWRFLRALAAAFIGGVITVYVFGIAWLVLVAGLTLSAASLATAVFLPGDVLKAFIAAALSIKVADASQSRSLQ
jgi:biotin transport system substrate-specific component